MLSILDSSLARQVQDYVARNNVGLQTSIQRLSSGLRINGAADDAAGLAVSQSFRSQVDGLRQAADNTQSVSQLIQTADGGLTGTTAILQRIRQLSVQAANDTLTASDRSAIQDEVTQMVDTIDQIATTTQFNSIHLLDGSATQLVCQTGADSGQVLTLSLADMGSTALGLSASGGSGTVSTASTMSSVGINPGVLKITWKQGPSRSASVSITSGETFASVFSALAGQGVTASLSGDEITLSVTGSNLAAADQAGGNFASVTNLASATNHKTGPTDYLTSTAPFGGGGGSGGISELTSSSASQAISTVDDALTTVMSERSNLGAMQNQLTAQQANLSVSSINGAASNAQITDTNMGAESGRLVRAQIVSQASTAILAQATFTSKLLLRLL